MCKCGTKDGAHGLECPALRRCEEGKLLSKEEALQIEKESCSFCGGRWSHTPSCRLRQAAERLQETVPVTRETAGDKAKAKVGIGGGPTRATILPTDPAERKKYPVATGALDYFPDAIAAISHLSWKGNEQHNPGQPLHWARGKSADEADTLMRHFLQRGTIDSDGIRHSVKVAWRALAMLQKELEEEQQEKAA